MKQTLITAIASALTARENCKRAGQQAMADRWSEKLGKLSENLPSGSGIDCGSAIRMTTSREDRIVIRTSYHHMVEGTYDGWTDHDIIVTPSFVHGFRIRVTGRNRNDIKEYLGDVFDDALRASVPSEGVAT